MGHCKETIKAVWCKVDHKKAGGEALGRLLIVYPWTQRQFGHFGNLGSPDAICHNAKVIHHGERVLASITAGLDHLDNLKGHYSDLSHLHCEKLHVDPANFYRFGDCLLVTIATHLKSEFTPEVQCALHSAFYAIGDALAKQYH